MIGRPFEVIRAAHERFVGAARRVGLREVDLRLGERHVRLCFAGDALVPQVLPALRHLASGPGGTVPELTVYLWDTASTGVSMIAPPWPLDALGPAGVIPGATADGLHAFFRMDTGMLTVLDAAARTGILWIRDARDVDPGDRAGPLRQLLAVYFAEPGWCVTHAGAVGLAGKGVLLGGRGGSGKSTTTLLCLQAGLDFVGDDYVLVDAAREPAPRAHSLYASAKLAAPDDGHLPALAPAFGPGRPGDKAIAFLHEHAPERMCRDLELVALAMPVVTGQRDTRAVPISAAAALRGLAPSTVFQHGGGGARTLAVLAKLTQRVPCLRLELGTDRAQIPARLVELCDISRRSA